MKQVTDDQPVTRKAGTHECELCHWIGLESEKKQKPEIDAPYILVDVCPVCEGINFIDGEDLIYSHTNLKMKEDDDTHSSEKKDD